MSLGMAEQILHRIRWSLPASRACLWLMAKLVRRGSAVRGEPWSPSCVPRPRYPWRCQGRVQGQPWESASHSRGAAESPNTPLKLFELLLEMTASPRYGVLRSALEPSAQEGHGTVGAGPKKGYKNDPRAGAPLL